MRNYNYTGNLHPFAAVICHSADLEGIRPILDEIVKSGIRLNVLEENSSNGETVLKKACAVLCVLSGKFYESTRMQEILLKSDALNKELIPMRLEEAGMPELISRMIYATNSINLQKYTPAEAAARILEAPVLAPAFEQMLPALFGGLGVAFVSKNWKIAVAPVLLMLVLFIFVPALNAGTVGIMVPVSVVFTIAVARILYKRGVL